MISLYADKGPATATPPKTSGSIRLYNDAPPKTATPAPQPASPAAPGASKGTPMVQTTIPSLPLPKTPAKPVVTTGPKYGASNITDLSNKPLETFKNDKVQASQLLDDRVYPGFDPSVPTKLDASHLHNDRMPEAVSSKIKKELGGAYSDELDHKIALELSGSNNPANLKIEPGRQGGLSAAHDQLENQLTKHVVKGELSLLDAQRALAKAKGYTLREDLAPGEVDQNAGKPLIEGKPVTAPGPSAGDRAMKGYPGTLQAIADLQTNPLSLHTSFKDIITTPFKDMTEASDRFNETLGATIKGFQNHEGAAANLNHVIETATSFAGGALSPITSMFDAASKLPVAGTFVKLLFNIPFAFVGDVGGDNGVLALHGLAKAGVISPDAAAKLEPGVREFSALIAQIAAGKGTEALEESLSKKVGPEQAAKVIQHAEEIVKETPKAAPVEAAKSAEPAKAMATAESVPPQPAAASASPIRPDAKALPAAELPAVEGSGVTKTRGLAAGVEAKAVENKLTQGFGDLPEYQSVNIKEQAAQAHDIMTADYERAKRIAMGTEAPPKDLLPESVFVAVEDRAIKEGDVNTLRELATRSELANQATTMGQRLRTLAERNPDSPVSAIRDVADAREKAASRQMKGKDLKAARKETASQIKAEIKKTTPTRETWTSFVESLKC